jgi:hypothetical protein
MLSTLSKNTLLKESVTWMYRFMPSDMSVTWNINILGKIGKSLTEASSEITMVVKYLSANKKATVYEISLLFSPKRQRLILSAANNHTFITKIDNRNLTVEFESGQSDFLPSLHFDTFKESQKVRSLLIVDLVVESVIIALNICGFEAISPTKVRENLLFVKEILQSKDLISFFENILETTDSSTAKTKLVFDLLFTLQRKGVLLEIICKLIDATGWLNGFIALGKVTVLIIAATQLPVWFYFVDKLLKGSELLKKIDTLKQISQKVLKSKL